MLNKTTADKTVHCEITGKESSLSDSVVLTKINGILVLNNFENPRVSEIEKTIFSSSQPPIKYYSEIDVPDNLKFVLGRLFSFINDEDEIEQTNSIISSEGKKLYTGRQLLPLIPYVEKFGRISIPDTTFMALIDNKAITKLQNCDSWALPYNSVGKKYRFKKIVQEQKQKQTFGRPGILFPGFDVAVSDCSQKNPVGTGYLFKTDNNFQNVNLSCNESAMDFCIENKCLIYYNDFLNEGKLRILSSYTKDININLQNPYLFRSSNF